MTNNLFFDIETVPNFSKDEYVEIKNAMDSGTLTRGDNFYKFKYGALNPYEAKVILITYQINDEEPHYLKEWESSEKEILQKFFEVLDKRQKIGEKLTLIGFNIVSFDLPFLLVRMLENKIDTSWKTGFDTKWLFNRVFRFAYPHDLKHIHLPLNDFSGEGLVHDVIAKAYGFPTKDESGMENTERYFNNPEEIMNYVKKEFIYPQLYNKIKSEGLASKEKIKSLVVEFLENKNKKS